MVSLSWGGVEFKDKFIAFVDVLGFKQMVETAEAASGKWNLPQLLNLLKKLGTPESRERYVKRGPTVCPHSAYLQRDLDFQVTQISDCVVVSSEVSPAGVINLVSHCSTAVLELLVQGVMCRGYITRGRIYHSDDQVIGSGFQDAYSKERQVSAFKQAADDRGTPFVEIDGSVSHYIDAHGDACVKDMFGRMAKSDGTVTALFPFQGLAHSFIIAGFGIEFDPERERRAVENIRGIIRFLKDRVLECTDHTNEDAMRKARHYVGALDRQLVECDRTDEVIERLAGRLRR